MKEANDRDDTVYDKAFKVIESKKYNEENNITKFIPITPNLNPPHPNNNPPKNNEKNSNFPIPKVNTPTPQ